MINNVVFPHSVEVRPSFVIARLKDEPDGATTTATSIIAKFDLVKNFSLDAYGNPTVPNFHDPVFMDVATKRMIDPSSFAIVTSFDPNNIGSAVLRLQEEVSERDAKIDSLDKMVKQLSVGNDPRVTSLTASNEALRKELAEVTRDRNYQIERVDGLLDGMRRQSQTLSSSVKEVRELKEKVTKLTNDLLATANERDNRVDALAKEKAEEMLPNLRRDVEFYKRRTKELVEKLNDVEQTREAQREDNENEKKYMVVAYEREIRHLNKKLRKAKGRERCWVRQIEIERKNSGPRFAQAETLKKRVAELENNLTTVNSAFAAEREFSKDQVKNVERLEKALVKATEPVAGISLPDGKVVNLTLNLCGNVTINELHNYN